MRNYQELSTKDVFLIVKAVANKAKEIYDSKSETFIKQLETTPTKQYRSIYGLLNLKNNKAKYTKVYAKDEQAQVDKLQAQIDKLGTLIPAKAEYNSLVAHISTEAENEAIELLKKVIDNLDNKTLARAASKVANRK